uniref:Uncharacterized protein n=1 Tax=Arundo donax TaxID=35708 RepID=A0A0A9DNF2_ARUDO
MWRGYFFSDHHGHFSSDQQDNTKEDDSKEEEEELICMSPTSAYFGSMQCGLPLFTYEPKLYLLQTLCVM